ncbi:MAG TPA: PKD domain-containing protein, partial [Chitinophagaceae bacterium]|nr:PKD domain-containing protein [Chitinophagaceae bacterium]
MKKLIYIITAILLTGNAFSQVSTCCPQFSMRQLGSVMPCEGDSTCKENHNGGNPNGGSVVETITACKNSVQSYYVFPNLPGFTFNWTIVGGTPTSPSGNPAVITWGNGNSGLIQVIISDASGNCRDTITKKVCLLKSPIAAFTVAPGTTVCANQPVTFTNTSVGANSYGWNFGDGSGSTLANPPPHLYTTPGVYTVVLTASTASAGGSSPAGNDNRCGCTDTATAVIMVVAGTGPTITSSNCKKMLCPKDTVTYCVSPGCAPYNWNINGGVIVGPTTGSCIKVQWDMTPPAIMPASVSVTTGCSGPCGNGAVLNVPILWNNIPISGLNPVCVGTTASYSLPAMPGTFYTWTVTGGGGVIVGPNINTPTINVQWNGPAGNATITCNYNNPYSGCSGSTTMNVKVRKKFIITGPGTACTGTTGAYTVFGGGLANWTITPATGYTVGGLMTNAPGISVTWGPALVPVTYTITAIPVTFANYCDSSASITVVVNPTPVLNNIVGPTSVCPGSYYTYSVTSNLAGPFSWITSANGTIISQMGVNNDSVIVQWTLTGPHTLTAFQTINGCTGSKQLTPINNVPAVTITGPTPVCRDQTPHPTYTASGGLPAGSYTWSISPAAAGTIMGGQGTNAITVLWHGGVTPGTSTANVQVAVCNYAPVNYPVTITTPPNVTVTKTGSLCTLPGVTLSVSPALLCYQWYLNGVLLPGATTNPYVATTWGYYSVKCPTQCSGFGGIFIPREHIPNVSISANNKLSYCITETINLNLFSAAGGGCNYQWFKNGVPVAPASPSNSPLNVTTIGSYYQVVNCGNCKDTSNTITVFNINCDPGPGCDFSFLPKNFYNDLARSGPRPVSEPEEPPFTATLNIGTPTNLCNNPQFSAVYSFTAPHSLNSGIHWNFGDGGTFSTTTSGGFTPAHTYTSVGVYVVTATVQVNCPPPPTPHICTLTDTIHYRVPVAANFGASVNCEKIYLSNLSTVLSGCTITGYTWSATGPGSVTFSNPAAPSPVLTVGASGTYNVTLTVTSNAACNNCTATITLPVTVTLPSATFTVSSPVCAGTPIAFNAPGGASSYLWNFGDSYTSSLQNTTHAFGLTPTNPQIVLTTVSPLGCIAKDSVTISVIAPPPLTITPLQLICPGTMATITATAAPFVSYDWYHNGVLVQSGPSNTYTTSAIGTYYVIANTSSGGCAVKSVNTYVFNKPNPVADILGSAVACMTSGAATIYLYNSVNDPNTTYAWNLQGNNTVLSNTFDLNITVNATGNYSYILTATGANGCVARDTFCVVVGNSPVVNVSTTSTGTMCAGSLHTFNILIPNPNYIYQWSNGITGSSMSTSLPGMYMVMATDPANGCSNSAFAGVIQPRPSTILFPVGCDTLCDYDSIIPPLAMGGPIGPGSYTVQWFLNGNYGTPIYTGPILNLLGNIPPLIYGVNNISIVVTYNGCSDTSNAYNLLISKCDSCDCKGSSWGEIYGQQGEANPGLIRTPGGKKITAASLKAANVNIFNCGGSYTLKCKQPFTIYANYNCKDSLCPSKVTYSLQPPSGSPLTGTAPVTFTPTVSGTYTLTLYGWCDDKICDTCIITFKVTCDECDCKGSKWNGITLSQQNNNPAPAELGKVASNNAVVNPAKLVCGNTYDVKCKTSYSVNAGYTCVGANCPGSVQYVFTGPAGISTGTAPLNFSLTQSGTYTLTLYGYCGTTKCDSCVIKFKTECDTTSCCPYTITVSNPTTTQTTLAAPPATVITSTFNISGPPGNLFTEIRAEVVDYVLTSNYNNECLSCKSYPYSWASMYQPG